MEESRYFILDTQNGELIRGLGNNLGDIFNTGSFTGTKIQGIREFKKVDYKYIRVNNNATNTLWEKAPFTFRLFKYLNYKENALMFPNGVYVNQTNLAKDLNISRVYVCREFKKLKELKIINTIKKDRKVIYLLNPFIATKGSEIYIEVFDRFIKTEWERIAEQKGKRNELYRQETKSE